MADTMTALDNDEFYLDPTRITLLCGAAGYDGTQFKGLLASEHDIQINKTVARNSVLVPDQHQQHAERPRAPDQALADMARAIDTRLSQGGEEEKAAFKARVKSLVEDVPDLPDFQRFHDAFRDDPKSATQEGHMREAYYMAYDAASCEYVKLDSKDDRRAAGQGPGARLGEVRNSVSSRVSDHGAGPGRDERDHHVHAQARRQGDPRLRRA
jgi:arginine decarboxylase